MSISSRRPARSRWPVVGEATPEAARKKSRQGGAGTLAASTGRTRTGAGSPELCGHLSGYWFRGRRQWAGRKNFL
jgi:hypothetical protein